MKADNESAIEELRQGMEDLASEKEECDSANRNLETRNLELEAQIDKLEDCRVQLDAEVKRFGNLNFIDFAKCPFHNKCS